MNAPIPLEAGPWLRRGVHGGSVAVIAAGAAVLGATVLLDPRVRVLAVALIAAAAVGYLLARLPRSALPLAAIVGLLALGNLDLTLLVRLPVVHQETLVLVVLVLMGGAGAAALVRPDRPLVIPPALLFAGLFLALALSSLARAPDAVATRNAVFHQGVQMASLLAAFCWMRQPSRVRSLVLLMALAGAVSAVLGLWQFVDDSGFEARVAPYIAPDLRPLMGFWAEQQGRIGGIWVFAPSFSAFLALLLPATLYAVLRRPRGFPLPLAAGGVVVTCTALVLTGTRTTLLGGVAGSVALLIMLRPREGRRALRLGAAPVMAAVFLAVLVSARQSPDNNGLARLSLMLHGQSAAESMVGRDVIYGSVLRAWRSAPIIGVGLGNSQPAIEDATTYNSTPHSYWLGMLADTGLVGVMLVFLILCDVARHYRRLLAAPGPERESGIVLLCASIAALTGSIFDNGMLLWQIGVLFWMLQGAALALGQQLAAPAERAPEGWETRSAG